MLSMLMTESGDEDKIVHLAGSSLPSFGCCHLVGVYFAERGWAATTQSIAGPSVRSDLERQLDALGRSGGALSRFPARPGPGRCRCAAWPATSASS